MIKPLWILAVVAGATLWAITGFGYYICVCIPYQNSMALLCNSRKGDGESMCRLASGYQYGLMERYSHGKIKKDENKAIYWYTKSFESGYTDAGFRLANLYADHGIAQDNQQAIIWYTKAATAGHVYAARCLAEVYDQGLLGETKNKERVTFWKKRSSVNEKIP